MLDGIVVECDINIFLGNDYKFFEVLVIIFVVNNYLVEEKNKKVEVWEKVFIEKMRFFFSFNMIVFFFFEVGFLYN